MTLPVSNKTPAHIRQSKEDNTFLEHVQGLQKLGNNNDEQTSSRFTASPIYSPAPSGLRHHHVSDYYSGHQEMTGWQSENILLESDLMYRMFRQSGVENTGATIERASMVSSENLDKAIKSSALDAVVRLQTLVNILDNGTENQKNNVKNVLSQPNYRRYWDNGHKLICNEGENDEHYSAVIRLLQQIKSVLNTENH